MEPRARKLRDYITADRRDPFSSWINNLRDGKAKGIIRRRLFRILEGNFGDCEPVGEGISELRIDFGPGYRIYFAEDGDDVILLGGGDKSTQAADIRITKHRWSDYNA